MKFEIDDIDRIVISNIKTRALKRLTKENDFQFLLSIAKRTLKKSHYWTDDILFMVRVDGEKGTAFTPKNDKVHRLVNGITSPRFYRLKRNTINFDTEISDLEYSHYKQENCSMVALDFIYFFHNIENVCDILLECLPDFNGYTEDEFKNWLTNFTSRKFNSDLINLLYEDFLSVLHKNFKLENRPIGLDSVSYKLIAKNAIGIDYMAWKRGFLTVNEVKAAMIWKPICNGVK